MTAVVLWVALLTVAAVAVAVGLMCLGARALRIADDDGDGDV
jgi:hypothetical protein